MTDHILSDHHTPTGLELHCSCGWQGKGKRRSKLRDAFVEHLREAAHAGYENHNAALAAREEVQ